MYARPSTSEFVKMLRFLIILSVIGASYATATCQDLHKTQLASLTERMNQMLSSLYTPASAKSAAETNTTPPAPASSPAASASEPASLPYPYYPYPYSIPPQVIYVSPNQYPPLPFVPPTSVDPNLKPFKAPQPFEFAQPGPVDVNWGNHMDHYPYPQYPPPQYPSMPMPYPPQPYPPPYPYPPQPSVPPYQLPPQAYPPPPVPVPGYLLPPHYH